MAAQNNSHADILSIEPAYRERERKYTPRLPSEMTGKDAGTIAAYKQEKLRAILNHIQNDKAIFVTAEATNTAPSLPAGLANPFSSPFTRTGPRERVYFIDPGFKARDLRAEFRQETKPYGVKQTIKLARSRKQNAQYNTLDRVEHKARLSGFGINLQAVDSEEDKLWLQEHFNSQTLKPAFRMLSQRTRLSYHPEGNPAVEIELACDMVLIGETMFGRVWQDPKLEIELVKGPDDPVLANKILDREEQRLFELFDLEKQHKSNAVTGYEMLEKDLDEPGNRDRLSTMASDKKWWQPS